MPSGVYQRTEKHKSINKGRKYPNRKKPLTKGITLIHKICLQCGLDFTTNCFMPKKKYCSKSCSGKANIHISLYALSKIDREKQRQVVSNRKGEKHQNWVQDRTIIMEKHRMRGTMEWYNWRKSVFERDNYTCMECMKTGGKLEPHHIIPLRVSFERAFDIVNGVTLCRDCHKKTIKKEHIYEEKYFSITKL